MVIIAYIFFPLMMMLKGGWLNKIEAYNAWERKQHKVVQWFLDGTNASAILVGIFALTKLDPTMALLFGVAWWLYMMSSMGEEAGAVGDYNGGWGQYVENEDFGRRYGIKKAVTHGIAGGALLAAASDCWWFIIAGALFVPVYFIGSSVYLLIHKTRSWAYAEPIYGLAFAIAWGFV